MEEKVVMVACLNCGQPFNDLTNMGFCGPCWFEIEARKPPQHLLDMRTVHRGEKPQNASQQLLRGMMDKNPDKFLTRLEKAEHDWREQIIRLQPQQAPQKDAPREEEITDKASETVEDVIRELLAE